MALDRKSSMRAWFLPVRSVVAFIVETVVKLICRHATDDKPNGESITSDILDDECFNRDSSGAHQSRPERRIVTHISVFETETVQNKWTVPLASHHLCVVAVASREATA